MVYTKLKKFLEKISLLLGNLFIRLFISYFLLLTFFLFFSFLVLSYVNNQSIEDNINQVSDLVYNSLSEPLEFYLLSRAPSYLQEAKKKMDLFPFLLSFCVYDNKGQIILSSVKGNYNPLNFPFHPREDCFLLKDPNYGQICIKVYPLEIKLTDFLKPVSAYIRLDFSRTYFEEVSKKTSFWIFIGYLIFSLLALSLAFLFSSRFVNPLKKLLFATEQIKAGNFDYRLQVQSSVREIDHLIKSFNEMASALKAYATSLQKSREQFRIIADFTADWEYWEDPYGRFIYVSPACERITGYSPEDFIKNPQLIENIIHPDDKQAWLRHRQEVHLRRLSSQEFEFRIITADSSIKWISHVCNPVYNKEGVFLGIRGSNRDITYRKELEEKVFEAQKMESIARLAGGIAHDLNNLMTAIVGQAELLKMSSSPESKVCQRAEKIMEICERACELAEKLLDYARGRHFKPQPLNLNEIIQGTVRLQETALDGKIELALKLKSNLKPIFGDPNQLTQVIMNLVINAVEAMNNGGKLIIETQNVNLSQPREEIPPGEYVVLRVKDTGCGMDKKTIKKIFEPFFSTKDFGRGLGLAAVFGIIKNHKGYIKVFSEEGKGTTFEIYFPVYKTFISGNSVRESRPQFGA